MPLLSRFVVVLAAAPLCMPGLASAQSTTLAPRLLLLVGLALMLFGVGLRRRTADADLF
ncbi:MAG TPA: hypothetical protein VGO80_01770 [Solirubrobacteraceae bacterium]|nr:hypothetical protein [Solirubrobacteraceae bacterium]